MLKMLKGASAAALALALMAGSAPAEGLKAAADVRIAVVVHGASSDAYWSVVKRGVDDAARDTGAQVQYIAPQVFDSVEQAVRKTGANVSVIFVPPPSAADAGGHHPYAPSFSAQLRRRPPEPRTGSPALKSVRCVSARMTSERCGSTFCSRSSRRVCQAVEYGSRRGGRLDGQ